MLRMVLEPLRVYQVEHAALTSAAKKKSCELLDAHSLAGNAPALMDSVPFYNLLSGSLEAQALDRTRMLLVEPNLWADLLPAREKNLANQAVAFTTAACQGALLASKLMARRLRHPMKLFRVDLFPETEGEIVNDCEHLHTTWSWQHTKEHLGDVTEQKQKGRALEALACRVGSRPHHTSN
jgi:hypothetical protein